MIYSVNPDALVGALNQLLQTDRYAIQELCAAHVPCNEEMARHESVMVSVGDGRLRREGEYRLGILGLLNGLLAPMSVTGKALYGVYEDGVLVRFAYDYPHKEISP